MRKTLRDKFKYYICLLVSWLVPIPFLVAAGHANYFNDDFSYVEYIKTNWTGSLLSTAIDADILRWHTLEGRWFANFYDIFFHPYFWNGTKTLHLLMIILTALSFIGLYFFCLGIIKYLDLKTEKSYVLFLLVEITALSYEEYWHVYLWFVGSIYQLTTMLFLWGFALLLLAVTYKKTSLYVVSGIFLVCMGGCMFNFIAVGCLAVFLLVIFEYFKNQKINSSLLVVFVFTSISSIMTLFAPGNFVRKDISADDKVTIIEAVITSCKVLAREYFLFFTTTTFIGMMLIAFLFGIKQKKQIDKKVLVIIIPALVLGIYATILPFVYGYNIRVSSVSHYNRAQYFLDVTTLIGTFMVCFIAGMTIKLRTKEMNYSLLIAIFFSFSVLGTSFAETIPAKITTNYMNGDAKRYNDYWINVFEICENSSGQQVVIEQKIPKRVEGTTDIVLWEDENFYENKFVCKMFDIESISILGEEGTFNLE